MSTIRVVVLFLVAFAPSAISTFDCSGFTVADSSGQPWAFQYVTSWANHDQAVNACASSFPQGKLAVVRNLATAIYLYNVVINDPVLISGNVTTNARIGLRQLNNSDEPWGNWYWIDGVKCTNIVGDARCYPEISTFDDFKFTVEGHQDCGSISNYRLSPIYLDDLGCSTNNYGYICEIPSELFVLVFFQLNLCVSFSMFSANMSIGKLF
jgi:hypothetical protein